jgi:hypothetical protein
VQGEHVIERALELVLNFHTWTPAMRMTRSPSFCVIHTDRGNVSTPTVIPRMPMLERSSPVCWRYPPSNADVSESFPNSLKPERCHEVIPPSCFYGSGTLQNS